MSHSKAERSASSWPADFPAALGLRSAPLVFLVVGGAAVLLPYLLMPVIPGVDYPNHLARLAVLGAAPGSPIRTSFAPHWALMPNLGLDLVYMILKPVASADTVMRLCLVGGMIAMLAAATAIQRALHGRSTYALVFAPLCVAGLPVVMGYVNFVMSCGFVLSGLWLWLASRHRLTAMRVLALATIGAAAWLCHFAGFAMLVVFIACSRLWGARHVRTLAGAARAAAPVLAIALPGLAMSALAEPETVRYSQVTYGLFDLRGLLAPVMATGTRSDYVLLAALLAVLGGCLVFGHWRVAPAARPGLLVLALLVAALPWQVGAATDVSSRLVVPVLLLGLAASSLTFTPPFGVTGARLLMTIVALLIADRDVMILLQGQTEARDVAAFRAADQAITLHSRLMVAIDEWRQADCSRAPTAFSSIGPNTHLAAYATIDRGVWEPFIFAAKGKQPIRSVNVDVPGELPSLAPPTLDQLVPASSPNAPPDSTLPPGWPDHFDDLLIIGRGCTANPLPPRLKLQAKGPGFTLFAIQPAPKT